MRHYYRSYSTRSFPSTWPCGWRRFAYASGCAGDPDHAADRDSEDTRSFHESRAHRSRGGGFGARRPLRYLSYRLDLDDTQQRRVAELLDRLKIDREQARLDEKKTLSELASMVTGDEVSVDAFQRTLAPRVEAARNMQATVAKTMQELADILDADQRVELSALIRSGGFRI